MPLELLQNHCRICETKLVCQHLQSATKTEKMTAQEKLKNTFSEKQKTHSETEKMIGKQVALYSMLRVVCFLAMAVLGVYFANARLNFAVLATILVGLPIFLFLIKKHVNLKKRMQFHRFVKEINEQELERIGGKFQNTELDGSKFIDAKHPYSYDLDIFGKSSLFLQLNRCTSELGESNLAGWLKLKANKSEIEQRQSAIAELSADLDWRQNFQAKGKFGDEKQSQTKVLLDWMEKPLGFEPKAWMKVGRFLFPIIAIIGLAVYILTDLPFAVAFVGLIPNLILSASLHKKTADIAKHITDSVGVLKNYAELMQQIEQKELKSSYLQQSKSELLSGGEPASKAIHQLSEILYHLELKLNVWFYFLFGMWVAYDVQWFFALDKWKNQNEFRIRKWLNAVADFEAINSLSGFHFANADFTFPTISEQPFLFSAKSLGHPLIPSNVRVSNDFELGGKGKTAIITGSNMSGKSTFERTLGVNMVLAFAGSPVCANSLELSDFHVFTSMRTQDSLEENVSGFYAELRRIRQLLDQIETGKPTFYFLDEVLKGTNSEDRKNGAKAIIKKLSTTDSFGLITTHDLELGELATLNPDLAVNYSFNSRIENDKLVFPYSISEGVCHSFSATKLMASIGIEMEERV
jgi:hypothetical protein